MKMLRPIFLVIALFAVANTVNAQRDGYRPVDFSLELKNMHLWRGLEVTPDATAATQVWVQDRSGQFKAGVWGGAAFSGRFKEFDYFMSYEYRGFGIALWDIYNFSPGATYNNRDVFNYNAHETGHFVDLAIGYRFQGNFPLFISWATILFGRDRGERNEKNLYSTYVYAEYPVMVDRFVDLSLGMAGAFALDGESGSKANFYGRNGGIVNVNATVTKVLKFGNYSLPVSAMTMWNPVNKYANIQLSLRIF